MNESIFDNERYVQNVKRDWELITKEPLSEVRYIKGTLYAFCSELAGLRLFYYYRGNAKSRLQKDKNNDKTGWIFSLDAEG